jgi:hypothetical protein
MGFPLIKEDKEQLEFKAVLVKEQTEFMTQVNTAPIDRPILVLKASVRKLN